MVCVELPRTASVLRSHPERVVVRGVGREWNAWLEDINLEALRLRGLSVPAGTQLEVAVAGLGSVSATTTLLLGATVDADIFLTNQQRELLVEKLHTRAGAPGTTGVAAIALGAGLLRRVIAGTLH